MIAVIPARGGSKGLPRKNVRPMLGKPMLAHTIGAALEARLFDRVVVTSDDPEILGVARDWGAEAWLRPAELARDHSSSLDVLRHALTQKAAREATKFALLQPTSPLRTAEHIRAAYARMLEESAPSCVSVAECGHHPYKAIVEGPAGQWQPVRHASDLVSARQTLPRAIAPNGAIYLGAVDRFLETNDIMPARTSWFLMSAEASVDVDDEISFALAEELLRRRRRASASREEPK